MTLPPASPAADPTTVLHDLIRRAAAGNGDRPALVHGQESISFAELEVRIDRAADRAEQLVGRDGRLAVVGPNHPVWIELYYGAPAAGVVLTFLNHRLSAVEQARLVVRSGATAIVGDPSVLAGLAPLVDPRAFGWTEWNEHRVGEPTTALGRGSAADVSPDDAAWLLFTSGTTADPKGAVLTHRSVLAAVEASTAARPVPDDDVYLFCFPLGHVAGYNVVHRHAHARPVVLLDRFDPGAFCAAVDEHRVTSTSLAATMLSTLLDHLDDTPGAARQLRTLRSIAYGAAPMPASLLHRADDQLGVEFAQGYGMTELSGNAVFLDASDHRRGLAGEEHLLRAAGRAAPGVDVRIADDTDESLPVGAVGEILVRGPQVMAGYWEDPVATESALRGGWLHTGDVGRLDDEGLLYVVDRSKDVIITGGENVSSREVEDVLLEDPAVSRVAVVGVPDATWGENVCAVVVPHAPGGGGFDADALVARARTRLAGFKVPRHVVVVSELPVNAAGKVVKADLRARLVADRELLGPRR